jgi:hypothetical protein
MHDFHEAKEAQIVSEKLKILYIYVHWPVNPLNGAYELTIVVLEGRVYVNPSRTSKMPSLSLWTSAGNLLKILPAYWI